MRRLFVVIAALSIGVVVVAACSDFADSAPKVPPPDASGPGAGMSDAEATVTAIPDGGYGEGGLVGWIVVDPGQGGYAISEHEVTLGEYQDFLAADEPATYPSNPECAWKTSRAVTPCSGGDVGFNTKTAMSCVDWCDAYAYCTWRGGRLCGRIGGGTVDPDTVLGDDGGVPDEWTRACTGGGTVDRWAFGATANNDTCNVSEHDAGMDASQPRPAESQPGCVGDEPGLFDMTGNVWEWENSCVDGGPRQSEGCLIRGGGFRHPLAQAKCGSVTAVTRDSRLIDVGIRCCKDL